MLVDGQITITNDTDEDNINTIVKCYSLLSVIPGPPCNVRKMGVIDTTVKLMLSYPSELDTPIVSYYCASWYYLFPLMSS